MIQYVFPPYCRQYCMSYMEKWPKIITSNGLVEVKNGLFGHKLFEYKHRPNLSKTVGVTGRLATRLKVLNHCFIKWFSTGIVLSRLCAFQARHSAADGHRAAQQARRTQLEDNKPRCTEQASVKPCPGGIHGLGVHKHRADRIYSCGAIGISTPCWKLVIDYVNLRKQKRRSGTGNLSHTVKQRDNWQRCGFKIAGHKTCVYKRTKSHICCLRTEKRGITWKYLVIEPNSQDKLIALLRGHPSSHDHVRRPMLRRDEISA